MEVNPQVLEKLNKIALGSVKWTDLYDNEKELLGDLVKTEFTTGVIKGLKDYYLKNNTLTDKQMTRLKGQARNIFWSIHNI